ncbi:MAG: hypothetical protein HYX90_10530 [Chloroflexi bacterium]|nr:hypothetical protein [Chloroflexota bacterium]
MERPDIDSLPKETLIRLLKVYSRNWQTLDGLWFGNVEKEFGLEAAVRLDQANWEKQAALEAKRLKEALNLNEGGLGSVLKVLGLMSWQLTSPLPTIDTQTDSEIVFHYRQCAVQESRAKNGKPVFPCKKMKLTLLSGIASVVEPRAHVDVIHCPPDEPVQEWWCKWRLKLE